MVAVWLVVVLGVLVSVFLADLLWGRVSVVLEEAYEVYNVSGGRVYSLSLWVVEEGVYGELRVVCRNATVAMGERVVGGTGGLVVDLEGYRGPLVVACYGGGGEAVLYRRATLDGYVLLLPAVAAGVLAVFAARRGRRMVL